MYDGVVVDANGRPIWVRWNRRSLGRHEIARNPSMQEYDLIPEQGVLLQFVAVGRKIYGVVQSDEDVFMVARYDELVVVAEPPGDGP